MARCGNSLLNTHRDKAALDDLRSELKCKLKKLKRSSIAFSFECIKGARLGMFSGVA